MEGAHRISAQRTVATGRRPGSVAMMAALLILLISAVPDGPALAQSALRSEESWLRRRDRDGLSC